MENIPEKSAGVRNGLEKVDLCHNGQDRSTGQCPELQMDEFDFPPPPPDELTETTQLDKLRVTGEIIDAVRHAANISHHQAQIGVQTVVQMLLKNYADGTTEFSNHLAALLPCMDTPSVVSRIPELVKTSHDAKTLKGIFATLSEWKNDEQERSWALHEDQGEMEEILKDLLSTLSEADASISRFVMKDNHYRSVIALAELYQMETREPVRAKLRECLISVNRIDVGAVMVLADSILPMELGREFKECSSGDRSRLLDVTNLLALLMSTGEPFPISHHEHLGETFLTIVLKLVEDFAEQDEVLSNALVNLILAYNMQFQILNSNCTVLTLSSVEHAPHFSQRLVNLLNWGKDPLEQEFPHGPPRTNSVLKILYDIFRSEEAVTIFYINDVVVLIDIIVRWLTDFGPGEAEDEYRYQFLLLVQSILRNPYIPNPLSRLQVCVLPIQEFDYPASELCKQLAREILAEFPYDYEESD